MATNEICDLKEGKISQWLQTEINDSLRGKVRQKNAIAFLTGPKVQLIPAQGKALGCMGRGLVV